MVKLSAPTAVVTVGVLMFWYILQVSCIGKLTNNNSKRASTVFVPFSLPPLQLCLSLHSRSAPLYPYQCHAW